ncbi:MAG TPA: transglycosylase domain-containing protein [Saprospiraceae bacterium]|nr:transglycosylase domain-containing protein [Saprospiraceae bacterium]
MSLPQKIWTFIVTLPKRIINGLRDPKQRKKWFFQGIKLVGAFVLLLVFLFVLTWLGLFGSIPDNKALLAIRQPEASKIYSVDGKLMGKFYTKNRNNLQFEQIPPAFMTSLIATEDSRYWTHSGIDLRSWVRVFVKRMLMGQESAGGGSTLSQQLAKNLFPRKDYWLASMLINKYKEFITASRLEKVYSKEELLTFYINTVPFGEAIFGLDAAADRYFSKKAEQLNIEECATLVGLLKATGYYNPKNNPERALSRRNVVLYQMMVNGVIDSVALDSLKKLPLHLTYQRNTDSEGIALYFRNHIRPILLEWCDNHKKENGENYNLYTDGLKIYTTIDYGMQQYAEEALKIHMEKLQEIFDKQFDDWKEYEAPYTEAVLRSQRYENLKASGLSEEEILDAMSKPIPMKWWTWQGMIDTVASPLDSVRFSLKTLQGAVVAINPKTGGVMAWVGGDDAQQFNIDYVMTPRQPGSAFKPILYATAIDQGMDPCTFYANRLLRYNEFEGWTPGNADGIYEGIYSLPGALAKSINTIAVQLIFDVGVQEVANRARRMGITGEMKLVPSLALGTAEITLLELVSAYNTFLNKGIHRPYYYITKIEDQDGNVLEEFKSPGGVSVFTPETVGIMDQMMANVIDRGTAAPLRWKDLGVTGAIAGKTGTTQFQSDGVFVGMTPKLVAGAWVGCFDRRISFNSLRDGQGGKTALPIWGIFMKKLQQDPAYKSYFNAVWPEEYKWINNCPFTLDESELDELGVDPSTPRDSTYTGPRKFKIKEEKGLGHFIDNIFKKKDDKEKEGEKKKNN